MKIYAVQPPWNSDGNNPFPWVDTADGLLECDEILEARSLTSEWTPPVLVPDEPGPIPDALCCPAGFFVFSERCRQVLFPSVGASAEWLPAGVRGHGRFYIINPLRSFELGPRANVTTNPVSGNVSVVHAYDFDEAVIRDSSVFRVLHPRDSAARRAGLCRADLLTTELVVRAWQDAELVGVTFKLVAELGSA